MEPWTFVYVGDIQPGSPKSYRYNPSWIANWHQAKRQIQGINPDLVLVGGDLTRDGGLHRFELEEMQHELASLDCPVYVIPGNMDTGNKHTRVAGLHRDPDSCADVELNVTGAQLEQFASVFGPLWWSVDHKQVRFSGLADVVINSGLPHEAEFWRWAEQQRNRPRAQWHVWVTHYALFSERWDEPNWDIQDQEHYHDWYFCIDQPGRGQLIKLFKDTGTNLVISGHIHCHKRFDAAGIRFEIAPATCFGQWGNRWPDGDDTLGFLCYAVTDSGMNSTFVPLERTFQLPGYGPGGHPAPHKRDYTLAWERE